MSIPAEIIEGLVRALRSVPCACGADSVDKPVKDRRWIQCGPCKALAKYDAFVDSQVVIASHAGPD